MAEVIEKLRVLFSKALDGRLDLAELYAEWPEEQKHKTILEQLYEDIVDAVEHFPGASRMDDWVGSHEYMILYADSKILNKASDLRAIQACREHVVKEWKSPIRMDKVIDRCLETLGS
jgi:hypothetical protein